MTIMVGQRVRRREDPRFITGRGRYVDDFQLAGALHLTFVRSPFAHARITSIDADEAARLPGVQVFTAADIDLAVYPPPPFFEMDSRLFRPFVASEKVRFAGEIVAVVLAESREQSVDAAELVVVDYDPLEPVTDAEAAARDEVLLFEDVGTNVCVRVPPENPDPERFAGCEVVARGRLVSQRIAVCPIEPRATAAEVDADGRLHVWLSTQTPHQDKAGLSDFLKLAPERIRVVAPDVGGGFGGKGLAVEDVLVARMAQATGRPVRWTETRSENLVAMHQGRGQRAEFEIGGSRDGRVTALRVNILQDAGAYPQLGAILPTFSALMSSGVYAIPTIETSVTSVLTNTTPTGPYRGAGRPEATQMIERALDVFAAEVGLDPPEIRRRNFIGPDAFPFKTATGAEYDSGDYAAALDRALEHAGYAELRDEQERRRQSGDSVAMGIGISVYVEITNGIAETEFGAVEITPDGGAIVKTGSFSQGQGHETTFAQIASETLGIPIEEITVVKGDTDVVARGTGTYGSKSTQIGGMAARKASEEVVEQAKRLAAEELEASPQDLRLDTERGHFHVAGSPTPALSWGDLAQRLNAQDKLTELQIETDFEPQQPTFPFGAHVAVVEVDAETGRVELRRHVAVDDAGRIINPLVLEGQVHGGVAAGIGQALFEEVAYDEAGNPVTSNLVTYCLPGATELPSLETIEMETPTPVNSLGVKGIGESGTIGATPAVHSAVLDALAPFGVKDLDMPLNGEKVWRALQDGDAR
jgi:carbon-monoxide dehydrogenase large subunit